MRKLRTLKTGEHIFRLSMHEMKHESYYKMAIEYLGGKAYSEKDMYTEYVIKGEWATIKGLLITSVDTVSLIAELHQFYNLKSLFVLSQSECDVVYKMTANKKLYKLGYCTIDGFLNYFIKNVLQYNIFVVKAKDKIDLQKAIYSFVLNLYTRYNNKYFKVISTSIFNGVETLRCVTTNEINIDLQTLINESLDGIHASKKYIHCRFDLRDKLNELTNLFSLHENRSLLTSNISNAYGLLKIVNGDDILYNIHVYDFINKKMNLIGCIEDYKLFTSYLTRLGLETSNIFIREVNYSRFKDDISNWMLEFSNDLKERTLDNLRKYSETIRKDAYAVYNPFYRSDSIKPIAIGDICKLELVWDGDGEPSESSYTYQINDYDFITYYFEYMNRDEYDILNSEIMVTDITLN